MITKGKAKKKVVQKTVGTPRPKAAPKEACILQPVRHSDAPVQRKPQWINRQRVLVLSSRGISFIARHVMKDLEKMMPHSKCDSKLDNKKDMQMLCEMAEMKNCNKILYFEARKKKDLYLWMGCMPSGPSVKFLVENIHTTAELKMTGNALKASRPILSFDPSFDDQQHPHLGLLKEICVQIFGTPHHHPKSQPYFDKVFNFTWLKDRIWFRNFQIIEESGALAEIGPRFSLNPIKIFSGNFSGSVIWENPNYVPPNVIRRMLVEGKKNVYLQRVNARENLKDRKVLRRTDFSNRLDPTDEVFDESDSSAEEEINDEEEFDSDQSEVNTGEEDEEDDDDDME